MTRKYPDEAAVVLLSGGQDSATSLLWAKAIFQDVIAVTMQYGQRHSIEVKYATRFAATHGVKQILVDMSSLGMALGGALCNHEIPVSGEGNYQGLPSTFTPGRNMILLSVASSIAAGMGISHVVAGMCQTDFSGYPDCRQSFIDAFQAAFGIAINGPFDVHTPLMYLDKAATFDLASKCNGLGDVIHNTMTCYNGDETLWSWGRGCRQCPACLLRIRGFEQWSGVDCSQEVSVISAPAIL